MKNIDVLAIPIVGYNFRQHKPAPISMQSRLSRTRQLVILLTENMAENISKTIFLVAEAFVCRVSGKVAPDHSGGQSVVLF